MNSMYRRQFLKVLSSGSSAFWDFMPTVCDIAGIEPPEESDGISYLPVLEGKDNQRQHDYLYWERWHPGIQWIQALRWGDWKGFRKIQKNRIKDISYHPRLELYNLKEDIGEQKDLSDTNPDVVRKIETLMAEAHQPDPTGNIPTKPKFVFKPVNKK